ncbi:hypothetical protein P280DRAFT_519238 [Massarina eburnea CBS 473.64]|uniref:Luciferase domain-containing protein n=1 Tax=Massarina eburnea CBS 473.64 TaxID=1395130 RepID=A0A6A6RWX8_9PLEO|nr:hypothetical protein P280DRAFT_519238 [Massarina eburnea CBS 473.64]
MNIGAMLHLPPDMWDGVLSTENLHILSATLTLLLPVLAFLYIHHDYKAFLSLGPGGTPATPLGYSKLKLLSLFTLRDPLRPLPIPPHFRPQNGYLTPSSLPTRPGSRPSVRGIAPQRQQTQRSSGDMYKSLVAATRKLISEPANCLVEQTSCFEKHSSGIFASTPITRTCGGEVCHAHPSDGSMHTTLHPADANIVIENGWGERHPLARGGWCRRFVPREFMLIYAPRDKEEVEVIMKIVSAAVWWVAGIDVEKEGGERKDNEARVQGFLTDCRVCRVHSCGSNGMEKMTGDA